MKIFMTGATGFVGTYLAGRLIKEGYQVTILTPSLTGTESENGGALLPHRSSDHSRKMAGSRRRT